MTDEKVKTVECIQKELDGGKNLSGYERYLEWFNSFIWSSQLAFSWPFFIDLAGQWIEDNDINNNDIILVYWEETCGYPSKSWTKKENHEHGRCYEQFYDAKKNKWVDDIRKLNGICCDLFNFPNLEEDKFCDCIKSSHGNKPFWNFLRDIKGLNKAPDTKIVWSNIIRFDIGSKPIKEGTIKDKVTFITTHVELMNQEILAIRPRWVIILSGPNNENSLYNQIIEKVLRNQSDIDKEKDITWINKKGEPKGFLRYFSHFLWDIPAIQMYHPTYAFSRFNGKLLKNRKSLSENKEEHRVKIIEHIGILLRKKNWES